MLIVYGTGAIRAVCVCMLGSAVCPGVVAFVCGNARAFVTCYHLCRLAPHISLANPLILSGRTSPFGKDSRRCIHGGGALVVPVLQSYEYLSLLPMQIEINLRKTLTRNKLRVNVPSVFTVAIGTSEDMMNNAAQRLLGQAHTEVKKQVWIRC